MHICLPLITAEEAPSLGFYVRPRAHLLPVELNLSRLACDDLRHATITLNCSRRTNALRLVQDFRRAEFRPITSPNQNGKNLAWIRSVKVEKSRIAACSRSKMSTCDDATNRT